MVRKTIFVAVAALLVIVPMVAQQTEQRSPPAEQGKLVAAGVWVKVGDHSGSGVLTRNGDENFVWTNAHVVRHAHHAVLGIDGATGKAVAAVTYDDVWVVQEEYGGGRKTGEVWKLAKIVRVSPAEDLAVLLVYVKNWRPGAVFEKKDFLPKIGDDISHVGSPGGYGAMNSLLSGKCSAVGRVLHERSPVYDHVSLPAAKGCSGGAVYSKGGKVIGLLVAMLAGADSAGTLIVPTRRIWAYAERAGCTWALDGGVAVPADLGAVMQEVAPLSLPTMPPVGDDE